MSDSKRSNFLVFLFVFVDILGFSIVLPLFPYWRTLFGASPVAVGLLGTANALAQLVAAPVIGVLSDGYGRRPLLLLCLAGTFASFLLMAVSIHNYWLVLASRVLDGILGGNISLAQAYVSDITPVGPERSKRLGLLMAAYGLGFTLGPALGGVLGNALGRAGPVWLAALLTGANLLGVTLFLPESLPAERRATTYSLDKHPPATAALRFLARPHLGPLLLLRFVSGFVFTCVIETAFGFFNDDRLGLSARHSSYFMAFVGLIYSLTQSRVAGIIRIYGRRSLLHLSLLVAAAALAFWAGSTSLAGVVAAATVYAAVAGTVNTVVYTLITQVVEQQNVGGTLGLTAAVGSLTRVVAPTVSGALIEHFGSAAPHLVCCVLLLVSWPLVGAGIPQSLVDSDLADTTARQKDLKKAT
jgi:DHA1 family tetracycline resistance protein-like MFS transporter